MLTGTSTRSISRASPVELELGPVIQAMRNDYCQVLGPIAKQTDTCKSKQEQKEPGPRACNPWYCTKHDDAAIAEISSAAWDHSVKVWDAMRGVRS